MSSNDYEVITLSQGETMTYDGGNVVENILFDCTADDCALRISPSGDDWTMRNVGVKGTFDRGSGENTYESGHGDGFAELITNDEASSGNTITIEHCYFGDGCEPGVDLSFMTSSGSHGGHMEIRDSYFAHWNTAALYIAGSARSDEAGGTYAVRRCYMHDNNIASCRIASDGSIVEDCVIFNSNQIPWATFFGPLNDGIDAAQIAGRCIWSSYGDSSQTVDVVNCEIDGRNSQACPPDYGWPSDAEDTSCFGQAVNGSDSSFHVQGGNMVGGTSGSVTVDSDVGNDPDLTPPSTVPLSAEEAAGAEPLPRDTLTVLNETTDTKEYTIEFTGDNVEYGPNANTSSGDEFRDTVTDNGDGTWTIHGYVANLEDDFYIHDEGTITSITAPSDVYFQLNGNSVTRAELIGNEPISEPQNFGPDTVNGDSITASWDEPSSLGAGLAEYVTILSGGQYDSHQPTDRDVTFTGLEPNTQYEFGVYAVDEGGNESNTVTATATTEAQGPIEAPRNLDVHSIQTDGFSLDWDAPSQTGAGVAEYAVYINGAEYERVQTTQADITGLNSATEYTVGVSAIDADGDESDQTTLTVTTLEPGSIGAPQNITTSLVTQEGFEVLWDPPAETGPGLDHYTVYLDGSQVTTTQDTNHQFSGLDPSTTYVVDVTATDVNGNESNTASVQETTRSEQTVPPNPPVNLTAETVTSTSAAFTFDAPDVTGSADLSHYNVYRGGRQEITLSAGTTAFTLYGLYPGSHYSIHVTAVNEDEEESDASESVSITTDESGDNHGGTPIDPEDPGCGFGDVF